MGLFDFFKSNKNKSASLGANEPEENGEVSVKHELRLTARDLKADSQSIEKIVNKMVEEDPFKNFYSGRTKEDVTMLSKRIYKYENITTVNADFVQKEKGKILVTIEDVPLGFLPEEQAQTVQSYQDKYLLTVFVYANGGPYMEYDKDQDAVVEGEAPYGLDIYCQFT